MFYHPILYIKIILTPPYYHHHHHHQQQQQQQQQRPPTTTYHQSSGTTTTNQSPKLNQPTTPIDLAKHRSKPTPKDPMPQTSTNPNHPNSHQNNTQNPPHQHLKPPKHPATTDHQSQDPQPIQTQASNIDSTNPCPQQQNPGPWRAKLTIHDEQISPTTHGKQNPDVVVAYPQPTAPKSNIKPTTDPH